MCLILSVSRNRTRGSQARSDYDLHASTRTKRKPDRTRARPSRYGLNNRSPIIKLSTLLLRAHVRVFIGNGREKRKGSRTEREEKRNRSINGRASEKRARTVCRMIRRIAFFPLFYEKKFDGDHAANEGRTILEKRLLVGNSAVVNGIKKTRAKRREREKKRRNTTTEILYI